MEDKKQPSNKLIEITPQELTKAENNMLNKNQLGFLLKKTPKQHIYKRPGKGGGQWEYVTGTYVKKVLNLMFGWDWSFEVVEHKFDLTIKQAYVLGKLTVNSQGRSIVKMQFGRQDIKVKKSDGMPLDIGNDLKAATTDALKKCASELGIASDVYAPQEFKEISIVDEKTEMSEEQNRITTFLKNCETQDDLDIIKPNITEEYLEMYKEAQKRVNHLIKQKESK